MSMYRPSWKTILLCVLVWLALGVIAWGVVSLWWAWAWR